MFLTDEGLSEFVSDLILNPSPARIAAQAAFRSSYQGKSGSNCFTKVQMHVDADAVLRAYFRENADRIQGWFNVISPQGRGLVSLRDEFHVLANKNWDQIHR